MHSIRNMKSWCGAAPAPPLWFHVKYCGQHFIQSCQTFTSWPTVHKLFYYRMDLIQRTFNLLFILSFSLFEKGYFPLVSICSNHELTTKSWLILKTWASQQFRCLRVTKLPAPLLSVDPIELPPKEKDRFRRQGKGRRVFLGGIFF